MACSSRLAAESGATLQSAFIEGNVVVDGPILETLPGLNEAGPDIFAGLRLGTIAENKLLAGGSGAVAPTFDRAAPDPATAPFCLPQGTDAQPLWERPPCVIT